MTLAGLRPPIPYAIRLVDAAYFNRPRCVSCGAPEDQPHTTYCGSRLWVRQLSESVRWEQR